MSKSRWQASNDTGWLAFPYAANYEAYNPGFSTPGYRKIGDLVYLRGVITRNTATAIAGSTAGTLPDECWPAGQLIFEQHLSGVRCRVDVTAAGAIQHVDVGLDVGGYLSLDGIWFSVLP